jgi:hypothetical protein
VDTARRNPERIDYVVVLASDLVSVLVSVFAGVSDFVSELVELVSDFEELLEEPPFL